MRVGSKMRKSPKQAKDATWLSWNSKDEKRKEKAGRVNLKLGYNKFAQENHVPYQNFHHKVHYKTIETMLLDQTGNGALESK